MKYRLTIISLLTASLLFTPLALMAQASPATTATTTKPGLVEQVRSIDGEDVAHGDVAIDIGLRKRFSESESDIAELSLEPRMVLNSRLFDLYVRKLMLTYPISEMTIGEEKVAVVIDGKAQLFGVIPASLPYEVTVAYDEKVEDVSVSPQAWWSFLATKKSAENITGQIQTQVETARYLSRIQLRAFILNAVVDSVT